MALASRTPASTTTSLLLPTEAPFDGVGLMRFFADHAVPGLEAGDAGHFSRAVRLPHGIATVDIVLEEPADRTGNRSTGVVCSYSLGDEADRELLISRVRSLFDLDADSGEIDERLGRDPTLATSVATHPGVRLPGSLDARESLFRTLIGQQISVAAARTVLGRIVAELGEGDAAGGTRLFPTADALAEHGREVLRGPASRITAIIGVAEKLASGALTLDDDMDTSELTRKLVAIPGIGPWTAGYLAMRVFGNPDVLLTSDLVILQSAGSFGLPATARDLAEYGERWAPWRSYAGLHLWRAARDQRSALSPGR